MFKGLPRGQQLRYLKRQGIVGISRVTIRCVVLASTLIAYLAVSPRVVAAVEQLCKQSGLTASYPLVHALVFVVMASSLSVLMAAVLATALQSQGALGWKTLRRTRRRPKGVAAVGAYFSVLGVMIVTATGVTFATVGDFFAVVRFDKPLLALGAYGAAISSAVKLVVVGAVVCAILAAIVTRFFFLVRNRVRSERGAD